MTLGTKVGHDPGRIVLHRGPATPPLRKGHSSPLFSAHVCCGHGCPSQLLLSCCHNSSKFCHILLFVVELYAQWFLQAACQQ